MLALSYWFGAIAIFLGVNLFVYAIVTIIRQYIFKKNTRFMVRYIFISFLALTIIGGYGYSDTSKRN
jgi:colicin import membrane protein